MNKAFDKILERLDAKKQYFQKFYEADGKTEEDECINKATQLAFDDAKNIVQEVAEEYNGGWIACSERLPENIDFVLYTHKDGEVDICSIEYFYDYMDKFTAWQPLPEPFKERD